MASVREGQELFLVRVERGGPWDWSRGMREQEQWPEHAQFMNALVDDGVILLGGPVEGERGAFHVVDAASEDALRARFAADPWAQNGMLTITSVERWTILLAPEE
ncbi:MAG TPA: YciI family protein [Gaiellaceae bacterium]|nr:YciI family protein [Gaiellaceae bacterium]